jgi:calcineurin-like phosphoesterase
MNFTNEALVITIEAITSSENKWKRNMVSSYFVEYYTFISNSETPDDVYVTLTVHGNGSYKYTLNKADNQITFSNRMGADKAKEGKQFTTADIKLIDHEIEKLKMFL